MLPDDSHSLFTHLRRAYRAASREYRARLKDFDLTPRQATALSFIGRNPGQGVRALASSIDIDLPTCSVLVTRLEARGFITRSADPADRRRTRLDLTPSAVEILARTAEARRAADAALANVLGPDGTAFRELLDRVVRQLRTDAVEAERTADRPA